MSEVMHRASVFKVFGDPLFLKIKFSLQPEPHHTEFSTESSGAEPFHLVGLNQ